jgi:radical SAM protein with 4Fe4S-binding SPASM domain
VNNSYNLKELKIEVNRKCPLNCLHCSSNGAPQAPEKLDPSRVAELIREFADMGGETLAISGGEPLVYKNLPLILEICRSLGIHPDLYTSGVCSNGLLLSPISGDTLELLGQTCARVIFALHGAQAKTHDTLTQVVGSFDITMETMQGIVAAGISAEVHIVPTAINFGEIADMVRLLSSVGVKKASWLRFVPQGRGKINRDLLRLTKGQLRQLTHVRAKLQEMWPEVEIRTGSPFNILCPQSPTPCTAGLSVLAIRPDGAAVPCDAFKQFRVPDRFGNILENSLLEVWEKSDLLNKVRQIQQSRCNSPCASCPAYSRCNSGCLAQKAIAAGRLTNGKDPECLLEYAEVEGGEIEAVAVC